jgi:hypothetical protein
MIRNLVCKECNKDFVAGTLSARYCSSRCKELKVLRVDRERTASKIKTCKNCGKDFSPIHLKKKYCSHECRKKYVASLWRAVSHTKMCCICLSEFTTTISKKKTCSHQCQSKWINKKKRLKPKANRRNKTPCEFCGFSNLKAIHKHHINPQNGNAGGLMCLCANCHYIFHGVVGHGLYAETRTRADVLEVIKNGKLVSRHKWKSK